MVETDPELMILLSPLRFGVCWEFKIHEIKVLMMAVQYLLILCIEPSLYPLNVIYSYCALIWFAGIFLRISFLRVCIMLLRNTGL